MKRKRQWTWTMNERVTVFLPDFGIIRGWARSRGPVTTHVGFSLYSALPAVVEIRADQEGIQWVRGHDNAAGAQLLLTRSAS